MPKVTKETIRELIDAGVYTPRHQRGCPKNYARVIPLECAARGMTVEETRVKVREVFDSLPCECK